MTNNLVFTTYIRYDNPEEFERMICEVNPLFKKSFNNIYEPDTCPCPYLTVGKLDDTIVCACIFENFADEYDEELNDCKVSSLCCHPTNKGYGTKMMHYIHDYIKNNLTANRIVVHIDKDKINRLSLFYKKFGYEVDVDAVDEDDYDIPMYKII